MNDARQLPPHLTTIADTLRINDQPDQAALIDLAADAITSLIQELDRARQRHQQALTTAHQRTTELEQARADITHLTNQRDNAEDRAGHSAERTAQVIAAWENVRDQLAAAREELRQLRNEPGTTHDGHTIDKVRAVLNRHFMTDTEVTDAINDLQNTGILFRERTFA